MTKNPRIIIASAVLALLAAVAMYLCVTGPPDSAAAAADARNLETVRQASQDAQAKSPPPVKFDELPAKPSTGAREPLR